MPTMSENDTIILRLDEGDYAGVEFAYGTVSFGEDEKDENSRLNFDLTVTSVPPEYEHTALEVEQMTELHNIVGDILIDIITKYVEADTKSD